MKNLIPTLGVALFTVALAPLGFATSATGISSFEGEEEPTVRYIVSSDSFVTGDTFDNLTNATNGMRATLRYRVGNWWDGDRATTNKDRQRAEVKGLGVHQKNGETFDYQSTWRSNSTFTQAGHFCHIFQLKATDGDSGAPLITLSTDNGGNNGAVQHWSGTATGFTNARTFVHSAGTAMTVRIRVKVSTTASGEVRASINGDSLQGQTGLAIYRPQSTDYRPKWGLYRGVDSNDPIGDDYIEHTNVSANKITTTPPPTYNFEAESMSPTGSGATVSTANDTSASGGVLQFLNSDGVGDYIQFTTPSMAAGTYQVKLRYKSNTSRGQHNVTIDSTQVGGTVDQYASTQGYIEVTLGNRTFSSSGTHTIRMTVTGRNASATNYILSADRFTFVGQ